ncbi:hypothetical protein M1615_03885 [Patescibacteria group bacterium]|nr:hypothetical protein [Patescibacteria group bacterium]
MTKKAYYLVSFIIFLVLAIYITYPLIFHLGSLTPGLGDELFIAYIQNWVMHILFLNPFHLFDASIYFPYRNTLAFSDIFVTSSLLALIPTKILGEPMAAFNFTLITSLLLLGFSLFCLSFYITRDFAASLFSGILVIFSPAVLARAGHLQILSVEWVIFSVLFFVIYLNNPKYKYLLLSCLFFLLQVYNSFLPGYFIIFWVLFMIFFLFAYKKVRLKDIFSKKVMVILFFTLFITVPIIIPYYQVSNRFHYTRDIRDTIHFALQPEDLFYPSGVTRLQKPLLGLASLEKIPANAELKPGYLGLVFSLLVILSVVYAIKQFSRRDYILNSFFITSIFGLLLSLGPALHLGRHTIHKPFPIILPYALFYYIIPGFKGIRNSSRWEMLFIIASSVVIAIFLSSVLKNMKTTKKTMLCIILFLAIIAEYKFPMKFYGIPAKKDFPKVYHWIARQSKNESFIQMPIFNWDMWPYTEYELRREYYFTLSFPKMLNGYSGFSPPEWQKLVRYELLNFPTQDSISRLKKLGVDYILVDQTLYSRLNKNKFAVNTKTVPNIKEVLLNLENLKNVTFVKKIDDTYVYKISK